MPNGNVLITPIIINDNLIDVTIIPTEPGQPAIVDWRPKSAAFDVEADVTTVPEGEREEITLFSFNPSCIGFEGCIGKVQGQIPVGFKPGLPGVETLVQTFRVEDPCVLRPYSFHRGPRKGRGRSHCRHDCKEPV